MLRFPWHRTCPKSPSWGLLALAAGVSAALNPFVIGCAGPTEPMVAAATQEERRRQHLHFDPPQVMPDIRDAMAFSQGMAVRDPALDAILGMRIE